MRKNDLIKMLNEIDGNPEVVIWNGDECLHLDKPKLFPFNRLNRSTVINLRNAGRKMRNLPELTKNEIKKIPPEKWSPGNVDILMNKDVFEFENKILIQGKCKEY